MKTRQLMSILRVLAANPGLGNDVDLPKVRAGAYPCFRSRCALCLAWLFHARDCQCAKLAEILWSIVFCELLGCSLR